MRFWGVALAAGLSAAAFSAEAADKVSFGTNWLAEAEHGGYYQAVADGTYAKYGLDVDDPAGRPAGQQRHPARRRQDRLLHGRQHDRGLRRGRAERADRRRRRRFPERPADGDVASGRRPRQIHRSRQRRRSSSPRRRAVLPLDGLGLRLQGRQREALYVQSAPFIADKTSVQQGYVTSEPYAVEKQGGFKPNVFLFADHGFSTYATTIETRARDRRQEARPRAALRRCFGDRLVPLSLRRQHEGQRADQERQSGHDRRADRLLDRQDEGIRHRRFRRHARARASAP